MRRPCHALFSTSPRPRGEIGTRGVAGEGLAPHILLLVLFADRGPSPQPSPRKGGEREK